MHRSTTDNDMTCCNMEAGSVEVAEAQALIKVLLVSFTRKKLSDFKLIKSDLL